MIRQFRSRIVAAALPSALAIAALGCSHAESERGAEAPAPAAHARQAVEVPKPASQTFPLRRDPAPGVRTYVAQLSPLNDVEGEPVTGAATFAVDDERGTLRTALRATNVDPRMPLRVELQDEDVAVECPSRSAVIAGEIQEYPPPVDTEAVQVPLAQPDTDLRQLESPDFERGVLVVYGGAAPERNPVTGEPVDAPSSRRPVACGEVTRVN